MEGCGYECLHCVWVCVSLCVFLHFFKPKQIQTHFVLTKRVQTQFTAVEFKLKVVWTVRRLSSASSPAVFHPFVASLVTDGAAWWSSGKHTLILSACGFSHDTLISSHRSETDSILLLKWNFHFQIASCRVSDRLPWPKKKKVWAGALTPGSERWNSEKSAARLSQWPPSLARSLSWFRVRHKAPEANPDWRWDHAVLLLIKHL